MLPSTLNDQLLAELRAATARLLIDQGFSQSRIAKALGVSQAMISKYLARKPLGLAEPTRSDLDSAAQQLARALVGQPSLAEASIQVRLKFRDLQGNAGKLTLELRLTPPDHPAEKVKALLVEAARTAGALELKSLTPQVHINLAMALPGASRTDEVAAFPGRFVPLPGRTRPAAPPEFDASGHLAGLLLKIMPHRPELLAICNLRYSRLVAAALEGLGWRSLRLRYMEGELELPAASPSAEVLVDEGGFGREPALYLLGRDGPHVIERVAELLRAVKAEQERLDIIEMRV